MVEMFKNHVLSIFIATAFSLSQIVSVNANYLKNISQQEAFSASAVKQKVIRVAAYYVPSLDYRMKSQGVSERQIQKIAEAATIGVGMLIAGYIVGLISAIVTLVKDSVLIFKEVNSIKN